MPHKHKTIDVPFEVKSFHIKEDADGGASIGIVKGYASTFGNLDRAKDIIDPNAFDKTIADHKARGMRGIRILYNHDRNLLLGHAPIETVKVDEHGLYIEAHLNLDVTLAKDIYSFVKQGVLRDFSIGYIEREYSYNTETNINTVVEAELLETSIVNEPCNQMAVITEVKCAQDANALLELADRETKWDEKSTVEALLGQDKLKGACMWYNEKALDGETKHLFPFAAMVDGELKAIPQALFNIAAQLKGFKACPEISADDKRSMEKLLGKYYAAMNISTTFGKALTVDVLDVENVKSLQDVESMLGAVGFSKDARKTFISQVKSLTPASSRDDDGGTGGRDDQLVKAKELVKALEDLTATFTQ